MDEAIRCLRQEEGELLKAEDLEIGVVDQSGYHVIPTQDVKIILDNLN